MFSIIFLILAGICEPVLSETCYDKNHIPFGQECSNGCCGDFDYNYCCLEVGAIAGITIGSLIGFAALIAIITCVCCKSQGTNGRVVHPHVSGPAVAIVNTSYTPGSVRDQTAIYPQGMVAPPEMAPFSPGQGPAYPPPYTAPVAQPLKQ